MTVKKLTHDKDERQIVDIPSFPDDIPATKAKCAPKYTPIEKLIYYRSKGLSLREVGDMVGIKKQSVAEAFERHGIDTKPQQSWLKDGLEGLLRWKVSVILNSLTAAELKAIPPSQRAIIAGIFIDKLHDKIALMDTTESYDAIKDDEIKAVQARLTRERKRAKIEAEIAKLEHQTIDGTPATTPPPPQEI